MARRKLLNKKTLTLGALAAGAYLLFFRKPQGRVAGLGAFRRLKDVVRKMPAAPPPVTAPTSALFTTMPVPAPTGGKVISLFDRIKNVTQQVPTATPPSAWKRRRPGQPLFRPFGK